MVPISRRSFLRGAALSAGLLSVPLLDRQALLARVAAQEAGPYQSATWTLSGPAGWVDGDAVGLSRPAQGGVALTEGSSGTYLSLPHELPFPADGAGLRWLLDGAPPEALELRFRSGPDGRTWGDWQAVTASPHGGHVTGETGESSDLLSASGRFLQFEATLRVVDGRRPVLREVTVNALGSQGPDLAAAQAAGRVPISASGDGSSVGPPAPRIISRAGWGCPEPTWSSWTPSYQNAVKFFVHHTVTTNNDVNPPATVRAIWQYHARTQGWGDIGYNFLIDRYGNIYEGRFGGDNVVAGHALCYNRGSIGIALLGDFTSTEPSGAAIDALIALIAWKTYQQRINPLQSDYFVNRTLNNICGHRDGNDGCGFRTTCPGTQLYDRLNNVRHEVWGRLPEYALAWGKNITTPGRMRTGEVVGVPFEVTNLGRLVWNNTDPSPWVLGYHWYRSDGSQYVQPHEEDKRTKLPVVLEFGRGTSFTGYVQAPRESGNYTLRWDMVHEGDTWLAARGNPTVDANIEVYSDQPPPPSRPEYGAEWGSHNTPIRLAPGQTLTVQMDIKNTGTATWHAIAPNSFRVGYHWFRADGSQYVQTGDDDLRTHFPREVHTDEWVTVHAGLKAPNEPGRFMLRWDIVHEGVTWFDGRGNPALFVTVDVQGSLNRVFAPLAARSPS